MDSEKLLWATGVNHQRREKQKKLSDNSATDKDHGASILRGNVVSPENVENDEQRRTAVINWL